MSEMHTHNSASGEIWVCHLGVTPYREALEMQHRVRALRQAGEIADTLLLLEHPAVYTRGRRSLEDELVLGEDFYRERGIEIVDVDRGGRITVHEPGQLVGYPIMHVTDVVRHVRTMESAIIAALAEEGVAARARAQEGPDFTGVWVAERKIASIGVHVQRAVSSHGFAVNVVNELEPFGWVVACGLPGVSMTSLAAERPSASAADCARELQCFRRRIAHSFCQAHGRRQRLASPRMIGIDELLARPAAVTA